MSYATGILEIYLNDLKDTESIKKWEKISKRLIELYKFRNKLAHQPALEYEYVYSYPDDGGVLVLSIPKEEITVVPNRDDQKQRFDPIDDIALENHYKAIHQANYELNVFFSELIAMRRK